MAAGSLAAGMAFLPLWLNDSNGAMSLADLLSGWVRAAGWKTAGLLCPLETKSGLLLQIWPNRVEALAAPPPEWEDVAQSLNTSSGTVVWQLPQSSGRLYTQLQLPGQKSGLIWAERSPSEPWKEEDRAFLKLSAALIERSSQLLSRVGPSIDSERLQQRLGDAAIIAGRMAHDFDNILTGIIGFADLTLPALPSESQAAKYVQEIAKVGQRGIVFTQQLHQLSRSGQTKPLPGNIAAVLTKEDSRLRGKYPHSLKMITDLPTGLPPVAMEASALSVVLGHILENAMEACSADGVISVVARALDLTIGEARHYLGRVDAGAHVEITIRDNGAGIKPEIRAKLFTEPFFTTKVRHRGLGLAIVYRILHAHRGGVRIDSPAPPETGTIARIVIPLAAARPAVIASASLTTPAFGG